jgi:hypothetical protein
MILKSIKNKEKWLQNFKEFDENLTKKLSIEIEYKTNPTYSINYVAELLQNCVIDSLIIGFTKIRLIENS